jgi:hypothetical protein
MDKMHPELERLLQQKTYEQLSPEEQIWVEAHCSPEEYRQFALLIRAASHPVETGPSPQVLNNLQAAMKAKQRRAFPLKYAMGSKIVAWQAAAAMLILVFATHLFTKNSLKQDVNTSPQIVYQIDTIEQIKVLHDTIVQTIYAVQPAIAAVLDTFTPASVLQTNPAILAKTTPIDLEPARIGQSLGHSIRDDSILMRLAGEVR